mmetsp:Transcript_64810/g.211200  ORF Transcript_64810/g.211200 Transcript_64810/m.211200 type:complete len:339 (+) Transcript_64810:535-1551(+)
MQTGPHTSFQCAFAIQLRELCRRQSPWRPSRRCCAGDNNEIGADGDAAALGGDRALCGVELQAEAQRQLECRGLPGHGDLAIVWVDPDPIRHPGSEHPRRGNDAKRFVVDAFWEEGSGRDSDGLCSDQSAHRNFSENGLHGTIDGGRQMCRGCFTCLLGKSALLSGLQEVLFRHRATPHQEVQELAMLRKHRDSGLCCCSSRSTFGSFLQPILDGFPRFLYTVVLHAVASCQAEARWRGRGESRWVLFGFRRPTDSNLRQGELPEGLGSEVVADARMHHVALQRQVVASLPCQLRRRRRRHIEGPLPLDAHGCSCWWWRASGRHAQRRHRRRSPDCHA